MARAAFSAKVVTCFVYDVVEVSPACLGIKAFNPAAIYPLMSEGVRLE